jgi:hypothetical protein
MNDFTVIKELASEQFLALCSDEAWQRDLAHLQNEVNDLLLESDIVLEQHEFSNVVKELTLNIIEELLTKKLLHTWFPNLSSVFPSDGFFSHDPVLLPTNEIMRRIKAYWDCQENNRLKLLECACFSAVKNNDLFRESPYIKHFSIYKKTLEEFINDVIDADCFVNRFISQYQKDFTDSFEGLDPKLTHKNIYPLKDILNVLDKTLFDRHISFKQYFHCWHIIQGYPPEMVNVKMILEMILTDCYCFKIKDHSHPNYLDENQLRIAVNEKLDQILKMLNFKEVIYE